MTSKEQAIRLVKEFSALMPSGPLTITQSGGHLHTDGPDSSNNLDNAKLCAKLCVSQIVLHKPQKPFVSDTMVYWRDVIQEIENIQ